MLFRILSFLVNLKIFFLSRTAWISLLGNLGLRFPSSIVCIQLLGNKGAGFCSILHSNSGSPEGSPPAFVLWNSTSSIFLELFHGCLQSWHYSLQRAGTLLCSAFPQHWALRLERCWCLSFNKYLIDWVDHQRSWIFSLGPQLLLSVQVLWTNLYNGCLNFLMCQGLSYHYVLT